MWNMSEGPSISESNGIATLEGKLKLNTQDSIQEGASAQAGKAVVQQTEFENAMTATVCLRIANYSLSGAKIENIHLQQRTSQGEDPSSSIQKNVQHMSYAKNIHFRF